MLQVQRWNAARDGAVNARRLRQRFEAQGLWVTERGLRPGAAYRSGEAGYDVLLVAVCGQLRATIGGHSVSLATGDALFVPRGTASVLEASGAAPATAHFAAFLPDAPLPSRVRASEMHEPGLACRYRFLTVSSAPRASAA